MSRRTTFTVDHDVDVRLSPANSFSPGFAALYIGDGLRIDLRDARQCDQLAQLLSAAAKSLRKTHGPLDMGRLD